MKNTLSSVKLRPPSSKAEFATRHGGTSKILILVICAAIIIGLLLFFFGENLLKPVGKKESPEKLPDQIEIIETEEGKIVRNKAEGYEVTVPKEWEVRGIDTKYITAEKIYKEFDPQTRVEGNFDIEILENQENLSLSDWVKKNDPIEGGVEIIQDLTKANIGEFDGYKRIINIMGELNYTIYYFMIENQIYKLKPNVIARFPNQQLKAENKELILSIEKNLADILRSFILSKVSN